MKSLQQNKELEFSSKYDQVHALSYFVKHENSFWRRLSNKREQHLARKALHLAGNPHSVLDLPCGTGRFWSMLAERPDREIHACDYSQEMINTGLQYRPAELVDRVSTFQASAFSLPVEDGFVDTVFCIRLLHHIGDHDDRMHILREFHRVARDTVIVSLWVDGNIRSWKRKRLERKRDKRPYQNRFVIPRTVIESEMKLAGFEITARLDFIPFMSMWRFYILKKC
ncbi:class I SAM-dependent methyltransferase [Methylophaga sp. OBS4]|uniref:class I SAM-dependent methyltransferase n=1 Tax=Methylophaga sp. OBS4 TaxID=2991935 RepID=UPI0022515F98|nr:class I SAM-dependent methyltransferase [Methylophaga sp. OBS4]MCX4186851.1 class I SAM-dependent methyltransferase [Methylophaga sp. OBS4]